MTISIRLGRTITVPSLVGTSTIYVKGLNVKVTYRNHNSIIAGFVISQSLAEGSVVSENTRITLEVSLGEYQWSDWIEASSQEAREVINSTVLYDVEYNSGYRLREKEYIYTGSSSAPAGYKACNGNPIISSSTSGYVNTPESSICDYGTFRLEKYSTTYYKYYYWAVEYSNNPTWFVARDYNTAVNQAAKLGVNNPTIRYLSLRTKTDQGERYYFSGYSDQGVYCIGNSAHMYKEGVEYTITTVEKKWKYEKWGEWSAWSVGSFDERTYTGQVEQKVNFYIRYRHK